MILLGTLPVSRAEAIIAEQTVTLPAMDSRVILFARTQCGHFSKFTNSKIGSVKFSGVLYDEPIVQF